MRKLVAGVAWWALVVGLLVLVLLRWFHPLSQWAGCMREYPLRPAWCLHVPRDLEVKP